ncbi:MAG: DUF853 family protein [Planctomycetes bacterium]|nr:DUF853 family protein [Planctomycetota bacterium]MCR4318227.1 DUF853 family protein [Planctomycetota bacterium]
MSNEVPAEFADAGKDSPGKVRERSAPLFVGTDSSGEAVVLPPSMLLRHVMCLGSSGSGKTVFCKALVEECVRADVPVIALDPQGDIVSLALRGSPEELAKQGVDPSLAEEYFAKVEVAIWTPASRLGIPLSLNPLALGGLDGLAHEERIREISAISASIADLLGYDLRKKEGGYVTAMFDVVFAHIMKVSPSARDISDLIDLLDSLPDGLAEEVERVAGNGLRKEVIRRLATLTIGGKSLLFELGTPMSVETLLGKNDQSPANGKTRLSIIYLNTLASKEEKAFFVSRLSSALYSWMLRNPSKEPQAMLYIDEVAAFLPPVIKTACKESLVTLFKQARKYGVSCLLATQNPGDLDYKALSQFSTWNLGRLVANQDREKVKGFLKSLSGSDAERIVDRLSGLGPGEFVLLAPDLREDPIELKVRWLASDHRTIDSDGIPSLVPDELRALLCPKQKAQDSQVRLDEVAEAVESRKESDSSDVDSEEAEETSLAEDKNRALAKAVEILLSQREALCAETLANLTGASAQYLKKQLNKAAEEGVIQRYDRSRPHVYFHTDVKLRPEFGLRSQVLAASMNVVEAKARTLAERHLDTKFLVMKSETISRARLIQFPLYQIGFAGEMTEGFIFKSLTKRDDFLYLDARKLKTLFLNSTGWHFKDTATENLLKVDDLDGRMKTKIVDPGALDLSPQMLEGLKTPEEAVKAFKRKYEPEVLSSVLMFMPVWQITARNGDSGKEREIHIDAVIGSLFELP